MARGLSKLQKQILIIAYRKPDKAIRNRDVLCQVYGFPVRLDAKFTRLSSLVFNRNQIGLQRYRSCTVSVVKAFNRLCERGLAYRKYNPYVNGIFLTREGIEIAIGLCENSG